jgi:hypothetical protein
MARFIMSCSCNQGADTCHGSHSSSSAEEAEHSIHCHQETPSLQEFLKNGHVVCNFADLTIDLRHLFIKLSFKTAKDPRCRLSTGVSQEKLLSIYPFCFPFPAIDRTQKLDAPRSRFVYPHSSQWTTSSRRHF